MSAGILRTAVLSLLVLAALALPAGARAAPEEPVTEAATGVSASEATLHGTLNPNAPGTAGFHFDWAQGGSCEGNETEQREEQTGEAIPVEALLTGLAPSSEYSFCLVATHLEGETLESLAGPALSFTTAGQAPAVDGESAGALSTNDARLEGQVNPENQETTYSFEYASSEALTGATVLPGAEPIPAGLGDQPAQVDLNEALTPGTTYFYRLNASNATGTTPGPVQSFTTVGAPLVAKTGEVQNVTRSTAQLHGGMIDPVGAETTYYYRYIDQAGYEQGLLEDPQDPYAHGGTSLPLGTLEAAYGDQATATAALTELAPATVYHFALFASSEAGASVGPDGAFETAPPTPPAASTGAAAAVSATAATLTGTVDPDGLDTSWELQLASEPGVFVTVATGALPASAGERALSIELSFLAPGTTYEYRLIATNPDASATTPPRSFATTAIPAPAALAPTPAIGFTPLASPIAREATSTPQNKRALTRRQQLARALRACHDKPKRKRPACERRAHILHAPAKRKK